MFRKTKGFVLLTALLLPASPAVREWIHIPITERSRPREQVQFWGGISSLALSAVALVVLISG